MIAGYEGEIAALAAAALWAVASILYATLPYRARDLATAKNSLATVVLAGWLSCVCWWSGRPLVLATATEVTLLSLSAVIGLAVGDGCYFRSIQLLGPRRALALTLLTPPLTAVLGALVLAEMLSSESWLAMLVILGGVLLVILEGGTASEIAAHQEASVSAGVGFALVGIVCQAVGSILIKLGSRNLPSLEATVIRLVAASLIGMAISLFTRCELAGADLAQYRQPRLLGRLVLAAFCGTVLGVWLMLYAFQHSPAGIAATLTSLSPVFVLPLVVCMLGQHVSLRGAAGAAIALGGVCWMFAAA